ncbi:IS3 family transposase [Clostridium thermarum]
MTQSRKKYTQEFKESIVKAAIETGNAALITRQHGISKELVYRWIRQSKETNKTSKTNSNKVNTDSSSLKTLETENETLKKLLGEKDLEIANKWIEAGYPKAKVLRIVGLNRSTYYYNLSGLKDVKGKSTGRLIAGYSLNKKGYKVPDEQIKEYIIQITENKGAFYGYLKLTKSLRRNFELNINKKKVYRLCKELNILKPQRKTKLKH